MPGASAQILTAIITDYYKTSYVEPQKKDGSRLSDDADR